MPHYAAPVDDWQFLLHDVLRIDQHHHLPGFADLDREFTGQILTAAADFHEAVLHPLNLAGDQEGARLQNGQVHTPKGFQQAWHAYREAGWHRLSLPTHLGGAGLPPLMAVPISELRAATGHSFSMYNSFCAPAASMLAQLGPAWVQSHVVPHLVAGTWTATMCMTEAQAGTDLRQITTRALPQPDGSWQLHGNKIFISGGDHDLAENVVHIVLAKIADPEGRISGDLASVGVFLVSKRRLDPLTGELGDAHGVQVDSLEHKMGIEGSATCALTFANATGWRIADDTQTGSAANMAPMFLLMNYARVGTAMSGIAYAHLAQQNAAAYARERRSGRARTSNAARSGAAHPIIAHPDVRRLLLEARAFLEGARAGALQVALWQSLAQHATDPQERQNAADLIHVLTPVLKAFYTDRGFDAAVACQQVYGGHGYIKDYGIEQWVRNARIGQLYEGANGVQAMDLIQRKLTAHQGRAQATLLETLMSTARTCAQNPALGPLATPLLQTLQQVHAAMARLDALRQTRPDLVDAAGYDLLTAVGIVFIGWNWLRIASALHNPPASGTVSPAQRQIKLTLAQVWIQRELPWVRALCERLEQGDCLLALEDAWV